MGAGEFGNGRKFGDFPVRVVSEVVGIVQEGDGGEGKVDVSGQPMWWSRNSSENLS